MADDRVVDQLIREAMPFLSRGDGGQAEVRLRRVIEVRPGHQDARFMLGAALAVQGKHEAAIEQFDVILKASRRNDRALAQKARSLDALDRRDAAVAAAEKVGLNADAWSLDTAGVVMTRAGRHQAAADFYARAVKLHDQPGFNYNLASSLVYLGRFDEARAAFRAALAGDPQHGPALAGLVQITRQTMEQNEIRRLSMALQRMGGNRDAVYTLGHALAKAYEDIGDMGQAMLWLGRAKEGLGARRAGPADAAMFAAAERSLAVSGAGTADGEPIFVLGLARSGTTLVDRILSSHSEIVSAGELNDFANVLKRATGVSGPRIASAELIDAAMSAELDGAGRAYMERASQAAGGVRRFIDKLPTNIMFAPLILRALPQAKVICLRRHPADVVLSNYRQVFEANAADMAYTYDLGDTARYVVHFERLVRRYAKELPADRFMVVQYEDIVADIEAQVRRMLDFCGLPFEEACVRFQENAAPVATASAMQVREPLNAAGVGRWRKYRPGLDPALEILRAAGVEPDGEISALPPS